MWLDCSQLRLTVAEVDASSCALPNVFVRSAIKCVQGYVISPNYKQGAFFTVQTIDVVRKAITEF